MVKILDCAQWLSLQVHPNDEQAERLEGKGFFGKTEAWYIIHAEPGARLIHGFQVDASPELVRDYLGNEKLADLLAEKHWREGGRELKSHLQYSGLRHTLGSAYVRRAGRRLLDMFPGGKRMRHDQPNPAPSWLTVQRFPLTQPANPVLPRRNFRPLSGRVRPQAPRVLPWSSWMKRSSV